MRPALKALLARDRAARERAHAWRRREALERVDAVTVLRDGRRIVNFCANDYLGLASHPGLAAAMRDVPAVGSGASALVSGYGPLHHELERRLAGFLGFESAVVVGSGYQANLALGQAMLGRGEAVLADRLNHASLNDGARLAGARVRRYAHADAEAAAARVSESTRWIATDGVFSMDGDVAPLGELVALADEHDLGLWLDDAHGIGVLGESGRGSIDYLAVDSEKIDAFVATFGKSLGTQGAVIAGDRALVEALINRARGIIYSTAPALPLVAATIRALELLQGESWRRERLADHIARFRDRAAGLELPASPSAIQQVVVGDNARACEFSDRLAERGFLVRAIRPPTVPRGTARLRITLSAAHEPEQIDRLVDALQELHE
ncbi:MAG: aminotransferase class I/II-fold pyridoxal phosphate-dependent enzyme [Candidatus Wenzhouxiangella sp. M2_3B_020]